MSIAVSAVVHPSRFLLVLTALISISTGLIGIAIAAGFIGSLSAVPRLALGSAAFFLALFGFYHGVRHRKTIQLDIYGTGLIRLSEPGSEGPCTHTNRPHVSGSGERVWLLKSSTIWPNLLLLHFRTGGGQTRVLPVLPDCVSRDGFRAISVACRWIASQAQDSDDDAL